MSPADVVVDPPIPPVPVGRLHELPPRQRAVVVGVDGDDELARRLAGCGLWPGVDIECLATAPLGGPRLFRLHGYRLALRRAEAQRIAIRHSPAAPSRGEDDR